jgi:EAL domain-containing protein (putative c-di-GMP-specific phosphodiesterase class I)
MFLLAMAKAMGLECIVEGVETSAQLEMLRENHCDLAQGYLFDRPLPVKEFEDRLNRRFYTIRI